MSDLISAVHKFRSAQSCLLYELDTLRGGDIQRFICIGENEKSLNALVVRSFKLI
jgi:hypothetical protein